MSIDMLPDAAVKHILDNAEEQLAADKAWGCSCPGGDSCGGFGPCGTMEQKPHDVEVVLTEMGYRKSGYSHNGATYWIKEEQ